MKVTDLMLGDWVKVNSQSLEVIFNTQVTEIGEDYIKTQGTGADEIWEDEIEPIPLSAEILEKNGFLVKHPESEKRTYLKDRAGQIVAHKNRGLLYFNISGNPWKFGWFHPTFAGHIRFVHELQRALKMCNIEKEITL